MKTSARDLEPASEPEVPSFDDLYAAHFPFVWRCLRGLGIQPPALDDAVQEVFLVVLRRLSDFEARSSVQTWLFGIVRNVAANHRRTIRRKESVADPIDPPLTRQLTEPGAGPLERAQNAEAAAFMTAFADSLDTDRREVFVLGVIEEMSGPEIAEVLSIPLNTAYTRLRAVRADLRKALRRKELCRG